MTKEPRLLCVSFFVPLVSGHRPGEVANLLFFMTLSCHCPCIFGGAGGSWTRVRNSYILGTTCL